MTTLNRVQRKVTLMDNSVGLPADKALVFSTTVISDEGTQGIIQQVIMEGNIKEHIEHHNKIRGNIIDEEILAKVGNEVKLRPIHLKDLTWAVA